MGMFFLFESKPLLIAFEAPGFVNIYVQARPNIVYLNNYAIDRSQRTKKSKIIKPDVLSYLTRGGKGMGGGGGLFRITLHFPRTIT